MFFGFGHYSSDIDARSSRSNGRRAANTKTTTDRDAFSGKAQVYDLAHERRLKALQCYVEQGHSLSEAARLVGVSNLTAFRWDDHGRR